MATYMAVKVGDRYILQLKPWTAKKRLRLLAGGLAVASWGAIRGGWLGLCLFGVGLTVVSGSLFGFGPLEAPASPAAETRPGWRHRVVSGRLGLPRAAETR